MIGGNYQYWERRSATRVARPGKLWWLGETAENFSVGWLADTSRSGLAFVTSAGRRLQAGEMIAVADEDPRSDIPECETLRICRVEDYGPGQKLVACTRFA